MLLLCIFELYGATKKIRGSLHFQSYYLPLHQCLGTTRQFIVFIGRRGFMALLAFSDTLVVADVTYIRFTAIFCCLLR